MTTYKCRYCNGHWQEGPTRDYCETEQCRKCASARIAELDTLLRQLICDVMGHHATNLCASEPLRDSAQRALLALDRMKGKP